MYNLRLENEQKTHELGQKLAQFARVGDFFALFGDLGAGKTTFSRGFIQEALQSDEEIPSPTFTLLQNYDCANGLLYHFDLYRLKSPDEIWELGWEEIGDGIALVEWPQNAGDFLPLNHLKIDIEFDAALRIANINIFGNGDFKEYWCAKIESIKNDFL